MKSFYLVLVFVIPHFTITLQDELYIPWKAKEVESIAWDIFESLTEGKIATLSDMEKSIRLLPYSGQQRFFIQLALLYSLVDMPPTYTKINKNLKQDLMALLTRQLLTEGNGPYKEKGFFEVVDWKVKPAFRPHYWATQMPLEEGKLFLQLWKNTPYKGDIDSASLYRILEAAVKRNFLEVVQEIWPYEKYLRMPHKAYVTTMAYSGGSEETKNFMREQIAASLPKLKKFEL